MVAKLKDSLSTISSSLFTAVSLVAIVIAGMLVFINLVLVGVIELAIQIKVKVSSLI
ncbi:hypothetical protein WSM22_06120 [Cytophagales bacterium WSM2-2]|nr:hypothetical protein WSM22_06120 [Cytophagales bacterium WSM2-2]